MSDIVLDYTNVMANAIGKKNGLTDEGITALKKVAKKSSDHLSRRRAKGTLPFFDLPYKIAEAKKIVTTAKKLQKDFENVVVLGIGGSALGTIALRDALLPANHNSLSNAKRKGTRLFVLDNIDPDHFSETLSSIDIKKTLFNVISKSGSTAETASQFLIIVDILKKHIGAKWKKHLLITTDQKAGSLRPIVDKLKLKSGIVPDGVGGRFTVFTPVSLLPAACAGIDIVELLAGAARMDERCKSKKLTDNPAHLFSTLNYLLDTSKGKKMAVMMPYSSKLYTIADWFRQMWAESLGKKEDLKGNPVYTGQTPIKALGATDQHSQVQLYVAGPFDKVVIFLEVENFDRKISIPKLFDEYSAFGYLGNKSLNELISVEKSGTEYALTSNNRPNMTIRLPEVSANNVGQLLFMLEVSTAFSGGLYNIDPFDQPGVEFGKQYTYAMFGREGFAEKAEGYKKAMGSEKREV